MAAGVTWYAVLPRAFNSDYMFGFKLWRTRAASNVSGSVLNRWITRLQYRDSRVRLLATQFGGSQQLIHSLTADYLQGNKATEERTWPPIRI